MEYLGYTEDNPTDHEQIGMRVAREENYRKYDALLNSTLSGFMQRIKLRGLNLN